ncbi:MAG: biotin transporter BioY [Clostridia bacterium]|nr:biotin transporter BioY [Clostridia bacterium]
MGKKFNTSIRNTRTYSLLSIALMAAIMCILAPMSIPIGPVPITLTNFAIYLSLYILDWKKGTISYLIYLLIGLVGFPVFSGFTGGIEKLAGPTGGYIIGFIPMAIIAGIAINKFKQKWIQLIGMIIGTVVCYAFGTLWFCLQSGNPVIAALSICVFPFIPGDLVKMIIAIFIATKIREKLDKVQNR